jgi:membrane protein implicated in regulation of membrane protease activity
MLLVFQVCFFTGIGLLVISFLFGSLFEAFGIDGLDLDIDFLGNSFFLPFNPILFVLFSTVFGGVGWIFSDYFPALGKLLILLAALSAGILVCMTMSKFLIKPLKNAQNTSTPNAEDLVGLRAVVSETIFKDGFGEIRYVINDNSYTSPAKATNGSEIKVGKDVAICWIEDHVFYVSSFDDI